MTDTTSPRPWRLEPDPFGYLTRIAAADEHSVTFDIREGDAALIVRAVNGEGQDAMFRDRYHRAQDDNIALQARVRQLEDQLSDRGLTVPYKTERLAAAQAKLDALLLAADKANVWMVSFGTIEHDPNIEAIRRDRDALRAAITKAREA